MLGCLNHKFENCNFICQHLSSSKAEQKRALRELKIGPLWKDSCFGPFSLFTLFNASTISHCRGASQYLQSSLRLEWELLISLQSCNFYLFRDKYEWKFWGDTLSNSLTWSANEGLRYEVERYLRFYVPEQGFKGSWLNNNARKLANTPRSLT